MLGQYVTVLVILIHGCYSDRSFTIVTDVTASMKEEIELLKNNIETVLQAAKNKNFVNYILLPFGDDVGPPLVASNPDQLVDWIDLIVVSGGHECPEDSLAAIEEALQISKPNSYIYVFTDAQAKTRNQLNSIQSLCQTKGSQVFIFQSGKCVPEGPTQLENENTYYDIANSCGGSVFHFNLGNLHHVFKYMQEVSNVVWSDINSYTEFTGARRFTFTMDVYTKDFIVAVSGNYPKITIKSIYGDSPHLQKIVDTHALLVIRVVNAVAGDLTTDVKCDGPAVATFYIRKEISFEIGFSPVKARKLRETSSKPLPDALSYMLISLPQESTAELTSVQLKMADNNEFKLLQFNTLDESKKLYIAEMYFEARRGFSISIRCRDVANNQEITGNSADLEPQRFSQLAVYEAPSVAILEPESALIEFGASYTGACKINSNMKPDMIWWENDEEVVLKSETALLLYPYFYISYVNIENVTRNETIACKCKNDFGVAAVPINIYVNRSLVFEVIQYPAETTVEFGGEGKLFCEADTYPEADIKWYHNDTLIEESENIEINNEEHMLLIKNMKIDDTGDYKCEIANSIKTESFEAKVYITGLEAPQVEVEATEIVLKPGDFTKENCTVIKGIPMPEVTWKYKSHNENLDYDPVPDGVIVDGSSLKIPSVDTIHEGFYVCEAINLLGVDAQEVAVKVQYAPKMKYSDEIKIVKEGDKVELPCDVEAIPKANIHWDMYQDDVIVAFDKRHHTDDRNTHRFTAQYKDSGIYHCIAENEMGQATRSVTVNVLVAPYIEHLPWDTLTVRTGTTLVIPCNVTSGNPVPSTKWQFISRNYVTTVLMRSKSMGSLDLVLRNITRRQEGSYECVAENEVLPDIIKFNLKVL